MSAKVHQMQPRPAKKRGEWLMNPKEPRQHELIGGGYFVFRRGDDTGRIRPSHWPFEHPTREAAEAEAAKLAAAQPGYRFNVVQVVSTHYATDDTPPAA